MSNKLSALDLAFLALEKQTTPVNVASLAIFQIPEGYDGNFPRDLLDKLEVQAPRPPSSSPLLQSPPSPGPPACPARNVTEL